MSPRWPSFSMSSCRMICILFLFAPVQRRQRESAAATSAFAATMPTASEIVLVLTPQKRELAPALQKLRLRRFGCCRRRGRVRCGRGVWRGGRRCRMGCAGCGCRARGLRACGAAGKGHERDVAGALDGYAEPTLVARTDAGHAARENLATLLHELRKDVGAFVVDEVHLLDAELADFFLAEVLTFSAARTARTSARAARATFSARTTGTAVAASGSTVTAGAAFATRCAARCLRLLWFICHNCLPF